MYLNGHNIPFEAICNDLFLTRYNPTTIPLCGSLLTYNWSKMSVRRIVSHVQTATSGGERLGIVSARFRRQLCVTVSCRPRYSQCVYNWGIL